MKKSSQDLWRVVDVLNWSKDYLTTKGIESPQLEAEWMLREVLQFSRLEIYMNHNRPLSQAERDRFKELLKRRIQGEPLQYILGYSEFMGLRFEVSPLVLIPRPETEVIVERMIQIFKDSESVRLLDIGTGSGNILIALTKYLPQAWGTGIDISQPALKVAAKNAEINNVAERIELHQLDFLAQKLDNNMTYDLVLSNPPYVAGKWFQQLPAVVKNYEPHVALDPGKDQYAFYRRLAAIIPPLLTEQGILAVEIGGTYQQSAVEQIFDKAGLSCREVIKDYQGQSRGILAHKSSVS